MPKVKRKWTKEQIVELLMNDNEAVERAVKAIYARQTEDEKHEKTTKHDNGRGFNAGDASVGTYMAKWCLRGNRLTGGWLHKARRMSLRYTRQLLEIANG